jgi:hypothetical protein
MFIVTCAQANGAASNAGNSKLQRNTSTSGEFAQGKWAQLNTSRAHKCEIKKESGAKNDGRRLRGQQPREGCESRST